MTWRARADLEKVIWGGLDAKIRELEMELCVLREWFAGTEEWVGHDGPCIYCPVCGGIHPDDAKASKPPRAGGHDPRCLNQEKKT